MRTRPPHGVSIPESYPTQKLPLFSDPRLFEKLDPEVRMNSGWRMQILTLNLTYGSWVLVYYPHIRGRQAWPQKMSADMSSTHQPHILYLTHVIRPSMPC